MRILIRLVLIFPVMVLLALAATAAIFWAPDVPVDSLKVR